MCGLRWLRLLIVITAVALCWPAGVLAAPGKANSKPAASSSKTKRPAWNSVKKVVHDFFAAQPDQHEADLISQQQARAALAEVEQLGWKPADAEEILKKVPSESEAMLRVLRSKNGKKLIRQTGSYSLVYDRLDRTAKLPGGVALLETITTLPDGAKYLKTKQKPGFKNLAQLLPKQANGKSPAGVDYDKPTGRIYTAKQFIAALEQSYLRKSR